MKKFLIAFVLLVALALLAVTLIVPRQIALERHIVIETSPDKIYPYIHNLKKWQEWQPWVAKDPDMVLTFEGPESGIGAKYSWDSESQGKGSMKIVQVAENRMVRTGLSFDGQGDSEATFTLEKIDDNKTNVVWYLTSDMGAGPIGKIFGVFLDGMVGPDFESGLKRLKGVAEASPMEGEELESKEAAPTLSPTPTI